MSRFVIAGYMPKPGLDLDLEKLVSRHYPILLAEGLVTKRLPIVLRSCNGTIIEIYETSSIYSKEKTASNPRVMKLWRQMDDICTYVPLGRLAEFQNLFPEFENVA